MGRLGAARRTGIEQRQVAGPGIAGEGRHAPAGLPLEFHRLIDRVQATAVRAEDKERGVAGPGQDPRRADGPGLVTARQDAFRLAIDVRQALGVGPDDQFLGRNASWRWHEVSSFGSRRMSTCRKRKCPVTFMSTGTPPRFPGHPMS